MHGAIPPFPQYVFTAWYLFKRRDNFTFVPLFIHVDKLRILSPVPPTFSSYIYIYPGTDNIPAELIKAGGETLYSEIHRLICCIWNKEELPQQWKESIIIPIYKNGDKADSNNYRGISLL
jgi:hypothetical protein